MTHHDPRRSIRRLGPAVPARSVGDASEMTSALERRLRRVAALSWAAPCSLVGLAIAAPLVCAGGSVRRVGHTLEIALAATESAVPPTLQRLRFAAITLGHVIVGRSHEVLERLRPHERVHVAQYERLGALFFLAYAGASLVAWCRGDCPYRDNAFERQAFALAADDADAEAR